MGRELNTNGQLREKKTRGGTQLWGERNSKGKRKKERRTSRDTYISMWRRGCVETEQMAIWEVEGSRKKKKEDKEFEKEKVEQGGVQIKGFQRDKDDPL